MNSLLLHVGAEPTKGEIPDPRNRQAGRESSSSFSEHLQDAVAAGSKVVRRAVEVHAPKAAKSTVSDAGKTVVSNARQRSTEPADSESTRGSGNGSRFKKTESGAPNAAGRTGAQARNTDGTEESRLEASASASQDEAPADGQSSIAQPAASGVAKTSPSKAARGTSDKSSQSFLALGTLAATPMATPILMSCDFTLAVTQPIAPAETNSAQAGAEPANCAVEPGSSGETTSSQTDSTDTAGSSASADKAVIAGNNNAAVTMNSALTNSIFDPMNSSDPAMTVEAQPVESLMPTDGEIAAQDGPKAGDESTPMKGSTSHNASPVAPPDIHGVAPPTPESFTGSVNVVTRMAAMPGKGFVEAPSSGLTSDTNAPASVSLHQGDPSMTHAPATSTESTPSNQAPSWPMPHSPQEDGPSVSSNAPADAASSTRTGGQSGANVPVDHPVPGVINLSSFGAPAASATVAFQPASAPGVISDSSSKSPAQAEATPRPAQDGVLEAWQSVSAHMERVSGATLNSLANGTEMRVQMHTDAFGPLEIRATLEAGKIGAAIGVENPEAHHTLLSQVSALQQSLADKHIQLDQVTVVRTSGQNSPDLGWNGDQQRDSTPYSRLAQQAGAQASAAESAFMPEAEAGQTEIQWGRLSVRA